MTTILLPFKYIDGIPTLKDSEILKIYSWLKKDNSLPTIFYNLDEHSLSEDFFLRFWKRKDLRMFIIFSSNKIAGLTWIDQIVDGTAKLHFTAFKWTFGPHAVPIFKSAAYQLFINHHLDVLIGHTPVVNRLAVRFTRKIGFQKCGIIPKSLYVRKLNLKVDAYVSYALKESFCRAYTDTSL